RERPVRTVPNCPTRRSSDLYEELEKDGLIYTIPGKGSFVAGFDEGRLRESKEQLVEEKLKEALSTAELLGVGRAELRRIIERLRSEEHTSELQSREKLVCRL